MNKLKKPFLILLLSIGSIFTFLIIYIFIIIIGSLITVNKKAIQKDEVEVFIYSNGVHTDIVMPTVSSQIDWRDVFSPLNTKAKDSTLQYVSIGWGDKGFYLNTPTWADLKFSTAFKAAFGLSESALHVTYYPTMTESSNCKRVMISKDNYQRLIAFIQQTAVLTETNKTSYIRTNANYGNTDAFYDAFGKYNLFNTCNTWANSALKSAHIKAALWTPLDKGIFYHYSS